MEMRRLSVLAVAFSLGACDVATDHYATLVDARADSLFQRGWLPDILPPSSHDIRTSNDLDLNTSSGQFHFKPQEFPQFAASLQPYTSRRSSLAGVEDDVSSFTNRGFTPYEYATLETVWVFLCDVPQGVCEYRMWPIQDSDV
jgi:hypothetical protein